MKARILIAMIALGAIGCAHERTEMDRELALKLADKTPVIVQSNPAPVVVNVGTQQSPSPQAVEEGLVAPTEDQLVSKICTTKPIYNIYGQFVRNATACR